MKRAERPRRPISTVRPAGPSRSRIRLAAWRGRTRRRGTGAAVVLSLLPCSTIIDPAQMHPGLSMDAVLAWMMARTEIAGRLAAASRSRRRLAAVAMGVAFGEFGAEQEDLGRIVDP